MKVAVVGATGLVGTKMLQVLEERNFPITDLLLVASEKSVGKELTFKGKTYKVISVEDAIKQKPDVGTIRHSHQLIIHGVAGGYHRKLGGNFSGEIWFEIYEIFVQNPRPDHIDSVHIRARGACPE